MLNRTMFALAATLATLAWPEARPLADPAGTVAFAPPPGPLIVTRTVTRALHDGNAIVARRSYLIAFEPDGDAYTVSGTLVASEVTAPAALRTIAELERTRADSVAFPVRIDRRGIIAGARGPAGPPDAAGGAQAARGIVESANMPTDEKRAADRFIAEAAARGTPLPWPADLFSPAAADWHDQREIALPDGTRGTVSVTHRVRARLASGIPAAFEREVVTAIGGSLRTSREEWTLGERTGP